MDSDDEGHQDDQEHSEAEDATSEKEETPIRKQTKRGPGRPKKVLTGKPGRPRKLFHEIPDEHEDDAEEPSNVSDVQQREDREL